VPGETSPAVDLNHQLGEVKLRQPGLDQRPESPVVGNYSSPQALVAIGVLVAMAIGGAALLWHPRR